MHTMIYVIMGRTSNSIRGATTDKELAQERLNELNDDWEMSGDNGPPYVMKAWPITDTAEDLKNAGKIKADIEEVEKAVNMINNLRPDLRQQIIDRQGQ